MKAGFEKQLNVVRSPLPSGSEASGVSLCRSDTRRGADVFVFPIFKIGVNGRYSRLSASDRLELTQKVNPKLILENL